MADGLTFTTTLASAPDGSKVATDDAGAAGHVHIVKLAVATDGSATALTADNTDGLLVNLGMNNDVTVAGVASAAHQVTQNGYLDGVETLLAGGLPAALGAQGALKVEGVASGTAQPVSAASLPLPSGAATSTLQGGGLPAALGAGGGLKVDGSGTALPVSGTVTATVAAKAILWQAAPVSRSTVLTTELNALANAACSAVGPEIDNSTNLDQYGCVDIVLATLDPAAGGYLQLFIIQAVGGTTYEDPPTTTTNPGTHMLVATLNLLDTSSAKRVQSAWFRLPPSKIKFVLYNGSGVALNATGNTVTLYTGNDEVQ